MIAASSSLAAGVAGLVLVAALIAVAAGTFRDRVPGGRLLLGVLGLSIVYNVVEDHGAVLAASHPPDPRGTPAIHRRRRRAALP